MTLMSKKVRDTHDLRYSVSQAKAKMSELLRGVQGGRTAIVTDHGRDIVRIERIISSERLSVIQPRCVFSDVRNVRAPKAEGNVQLSVLELLHEDRTRR